jgi:polyhydroxybutyrate depolymerase
MFHGSSGTGEQFLRSSGWREQADETGLVAVFPTGLRYRVLDSGRRSTKWNGFGLEDDVSLEEKPAGYPDGAPWPADDVGFTDRIVRDLGRRLPIDPRRVYASGFSNGAEFAARLTVERADVLAAAAFSGGALPEPKPATRAVPTWLTAGALDDRIAEQTGLPELPLDPVALLSVPLVDATLDAHLGTLGLDESLFGALAQPGSTALRWPATGGGVFRFTLLGGMGHTYPHAGNNDAGFEAAPRFWDFFRAHPLP